MWYRRSDKLVYLLHSTLIMSHVAILQELDRRRRIPKTFRDRLNPLDYMDDETIISNYRLDRGSIFELISELKSQLEHPTSRSHSLPVSLQICVALRYFAKGDFLSEVADVHGLSRMSISRCIHSVSKALVEKSYKYISFPRNTEAQQVMKQRFYSICQFPNVLGAIDGTLIPIKCPRGNEEHLYISRKGFHCLNCQGIADADGKFLSIVAQWHGSAHDSCVWRSCHLRDEFEDGSIGGGWLLGDSGYPCRSYLMTPVQNPTTASQRAYNRAHKRTRVVVEKMFGIWKSRFRCLHKSGGCLMFSSQRCVNVIIATAVLHNIARDRVLFQISDDYEYDESQMDTEENNDHELSGITMRSQLIENYFDNL